MFDNKQFFGSVLHMITGDQYGATGQLSNGLTTDSKGNPIDPELNHVGTWGQTDLVAGFRTEALKPYGIGNTVEFKLGVNNVFNNQALTDIGGTPSALTPDKNKLTYTSQAPRNIYGAVKVDF